MSDLKITPRGTATGNGWEYQLERDGHVSDWIAYPTSFTIDPEDGQPIRANTTYWLYARNPSISEEDTFSAAVQVKEDNTVVSVDETGVPKDNTASIPSLLAQINGATGQERVEVLKLIAQAAVELDSEEVADLFCQLKELGNCGGGSTVKLPALTIGAQKIEKAVVTLDSIKIISATAYNENGTYNGVIGVAYYSDNSTREITSLGQRGVSSAVAQWSSGGVLTIGDVSSQTTVTLTLDYQGKHDEVALTIYNTDVIEPNGNYRITDASLVEGDETGTLVHLEQQYTGDNHWEAVTDPHLFEWVDPFPGLTVTMESLNARLKCAMDSIAQNTVKTLRAFRQASQAYNVTLQSETQSGNGTVYSHDGTKDGTIEYQFVNVPSAGNYPAVFRARSNTSAPIARITIGNGAPFDVPITATDGVIQSFNLVLPLPAGDVKVKIQPVGYFAQDSLQINGTGSAKEVLATVTIPIQNVDPICTSHPVLTQEQADAMTKISVYEYHEAGQYARVFSSRAEAIAIIPTHTEPGSVCGFDFNPCTSATADVGATLYNDNRLPSTQYPEEEHFRRPVEAGWWGWNRVSATDFYVLQTDACGNIISKEHITL